MRLSAIILLPIFVLSGCTTNYTDSDIKYVVDAWKNAQAPMATEPRLITLELSGMLSFEN